MRTLGTPLGLVFILGSALNAAVPALPGAPAEAAVLTPTATLRPTMPPLPGMLPAPAPENAGIPAAVAALAAAPEERYPKPNSAPVLSGALELKVSPAAHGPNVFLADLFDAALPPDVGVLAVDSVGGPGSVKTLEPALVAFKLKHAPGGPWTLKPFAGSLKVRVPAQNIPGKKLAAFALEYLEQQLSGTAGVGIEQQGGAIDLKLYDAPVRYRVRPQEDHSLRGYVVLRVEVLQSTVTDEERVVATVPISYLIRRQETRLFTTQPLHRGDPLGAQNLETHSIDATFAGDGFNDLASVQGKVASTYIPAGKAIEASMVDLPLSIRTGDSVRLLVRSGAIEIETTAKAMRDARVGDNLQLQVTDSGKMVQARCVDADVAVQNAY